MKRNNLDPQYLALCREILSVGELRSDRTGTGAYSVFGHQMRFNLAEGFPLLTTKKVHIKSIIHELLWFLSGDTNVKYLQDNGVTIWNEWADEHGNLGPVYGHQWRNFGATLEPDGSYLSDGVDQISELIHSLKTNPMSRRHIITGWNPKEINDVALPPCHTLSNFYVSKDGRLSCQLYARSQDVFLGTPFNIASYALLTMMLAQVCGLGLGDFVWTGGDCHIYSNHLEQVEEQLSRDSFPLPTMVLNPLVTDIFDFKFEDFTLCNYQSHPAIKAPIAV